MITYWQQEDGKLIEKDEEELDGRKSTWVDARSVTRDDIAVLEEKYGGATLVEAFAIVAVISGLVNIIFFPGTALLGASGLVFMMIILVSASDLRAGEIPISMILVIVIYLGSEVWSMISATDNVSQLTHIIGGLCGALFGGLLNSRK